MRVARVIFPWLCLWITILTAAGCRAADEARRYQLHGQILAVRPEAKEVLIKHGDIQNFMPGMTMPFKVRDARMLSGKTPGDLVTAQLMVGTNEAWLASLEKTGTAPIDGPAAIPHASFVKPLQPGDPVPDTPLTDQDGQPVSLTQWRGTALVITFIYVRCPLPEFCPLMDRRFGELQRAITSNPRLRGRVHLLSVSFDPDQDTPEVLTAHAKKAGADPTVWSFATAPRDVVDRFAATFGVNVIREADGTVTHNLRTAVIDQQGRVVQGHDSNQWTSAQVLDDLDRSLTH